MDRVAWGKRVRDFMVSIEDYPTLNHRKSLKEAFLLLIESLEAGRDYRNVIVVGDRGELLGVLSMMDLVEGILPSFLREPRAYQGHLQEDPGLSLIWQDILADAPRASVERKVGEALHPAKIVLHQEDPLTKAVYYMARHRLTLLPVVEGGKVVGVIRFLDIFKEISRVVLA
ncbi:MAG: CBS domain-containing protein [Aquificaceae bacterium]|nr:CBS domain-containing protein [Aquificaceae bacterium]MDW8032337.1 CBS domain-containing protein [Aquificaceae bacterium]MDW8294067.1 CBS domain-containing protein [Aquificaceae bacterium]